MKLAYKEIGIKVVYIVRNCKLLRIKDLYRLGWSNNMKIGVIADIHNNVVALEAILDVFKKNGCSEILCCGDIIGIGPYPEETVQYSDFELIKHIFYGVK